MIGFMYAVHYMLFMYPIAVNASPAYWLTRLKINKGNKKKTSFFFRKRG